MHRLIIIVSIHYQSFYLWITLSSCLFITIHIIIPYLRSWCNNPSTSFTNLSLYLISLSQFDTQIHYYQYHHIQLRSFAPIHYSYTLHITTGITLFNKRCLNWDKHSFASVVWIAKSSLWCCLSGNDLIKLLISWMEVYFINTS